jgi:hypothetical protein
VVEINRSHNNNQRQQTARPGVTQTGRVHIDQRRLVAELTGAREHKLGESRVWSLDF